MRRTDKEVEDKKVIKSIINQADYCVVAFSDNNMPYIIPLIFGYKNNCLYFHSAPEGKKIEILNRNNRISFSIITGTEIVKSENSCNWTMKYMSVNGEGYATFVTDFKQKKRCLDIIMTKYSGNNSVHTDEYTYTETSITQVVIIKVELTKLTCKISGY